MLRFIAASLCLRCQRVPVLPLHVRQCSTAGPVENKQTVDIFYDLAVDLRKVRKLKGWVLHQHPAYAKEAARLLWELGASGAVIANVLVTHPEAVLCSPEEMAAQRELWMSVCSNKKELVNIIDKFPASFFTSAVHHENQRNNIAYFQSLNLNKRIVSKLMASAPQSFSRPMEQNQLMVDTLRRSYIELGGEKDNMRIWLQKLLSQNPFVLLKSPDVLQQNLLFLKGKGFTTAELLHLLAKLRGFVTELSPDSMNQTLLYSQEMMGCSEEQLREIVLKCPALLYYPKQILADRFEGLLRARLSIAQIMETPTVLELTTEIINYRMERLRLQGFDLRKGGSVDVLKGTKKDFVQSFGKLKHSVQRPLFNPVAPLKTND